MTPTLEQLENRRKWVEALRTWTRGQCFLSYGHDWLGPRCALGVARDLFFATNGWGDSFLGLSTNEVFEVTGWNDKEKSDFPTIANRIEERWIKPYEGML